MAAWSTLSFNFAPFDPLKGPLEGILTGLEIIEAILEALLAIIKAFFLDLLNPLRAIIAALLAAIRAILNQIKSTGFSILLVHPDFSQPDFAGVLNSVGGAYPGFESKVVGKFFDTADIFRPTYPPGSSVAMMILYVGADSPGDLLGLLLSLLRFIKTPVNLGSLPAPVDLKVRPVTKSGAPITQFRRLFDSDLDQALVLEWRMPQAPSGSGIAGLVGQVSSLYTSFRFPGFIVERTGPIPAESGKSPSPQGELVQIKVDSPTLGKVITSTIEKYSFPPVTTKIVLREPNGNVYRDFPKKFEIGTSNIVEGNLTGSYQYVDDDSSLVPGKTYYYRVRAFFGDPVDYLATTSPSDFIDNRKLVKKDKNQLFINYGQDVTMGQASPAVKGFVPKPRPSSAAFDAYKNVRDATMVGVLLNFDFPPSVSGDTPKQAEQKTGWGTLSVLGGQMGPLKAAFPTSDKLISTTNSIGFPTGNVAVGATIGRLVNPILEKLYYTPELMDLLTQKWADGVQETVSQVLTFDQTTWKFIGVVGGFTKSAQDKTNAYLAIEETYVNGNPYNGPLPVSGDLTGVVTVDERRGLADFLRTALSLLTSSSSYLSWYSVTVGDLFPVFVPFIFDIEQFILAFLKAVESALKEITDIIETLLQKIRALEQLIITILDIIDILSIKVTVSVLTTSSSNGSAASLATDLLASEDKPGDSPFGLHSGLVITFGGPGEGFVAAFKALAFIFGI